MSKALNSNGVFLSFDLVRFRLHTPVFPFFLSFPFYFSPFFVTDRQAEESAGALTSLLVLLVPLWGWGRFFRFVLWFICDRPTEVSLDGLTDAPESGVGSSSDPSTPRIRNPKGGIGA